MKPLRNPGSTDKEHLRPSEAADYTSLSLSTLAKLRMARNRAKGPRYLKIAGCVVYRRSDLDDWMGLHLVEAIS